MAAQKPFTVALVSAFLISRENQALFVDPEKEEKINRWLNVLKKSKIRPMGADRISWFAYQKGRFDLAKRWSLVAKKTPLGRRIASKIALREGDIKKATKELEMALSVMVRAAST